MQDLVSFYFEQSRIRVLRSDDGNPLFVAADVCAVLEIANSRAATSRLPETMKGCREVDTLGGPQQMVVVNEAGLYRLVMTSRKPEAEAFTDWVASAVLPEIRRTGKYDPTGAHLPGGRLPTHLETAEALVEALRVKEKLERQIEADAPKVDFHDRVSAADGFQPIAAVAQELGTGEKRLFQLLRGRGFLKRDNCPYQEWIERGVFRLVVKTGEWAGREQVYRQTLVTPKGLTVLARELEDLLPPKQTGLPGLLV